MRFIQMKKPVLEYMYCMLLYVLIPANAMYSFVKSIYPHDISLAKSFFLS